MYGVESTFCLLIPLSYKQDDVVMIQALHSSQRELSICLAQPPSLGQLIKFNIPAIIIIITSYRCSPNNEEICRRPTIRFPCCIQGNEQEPPPFNLKWIAIPAHTFFPVFLFVWVAFSMPNICRRWNVITSLFHIHLLPTVQARGIGYRNLNSSCGVDTFWT